MTTRGIDGNGASQAAAPGTYGLAPRGYRLPALTRLGAVRLRISSLERSLSYYTSVLGMRVIERAGSCASLGADGGDRALVELNEVPGVRPMPGRGRLGLYHFALLLPDRASLGRFVRHLAESNVRAGAGDHLVSEAFYLQDPDGLGIEVYADRPRDTWRRVDRELMMATDPVDVDGLVRAAGDVAWTGMPAGTVMGHVHLHVGNLERAAEFFGDALGFDRTAWSYPGALFLAAGGYHHHLGTNVWAGPSAVPAGEDEAGLIEWTIELPDEADVAGAAASVAAAAHEVRREGRDAVTADPWGTGIWLRAVSR